MGNEVFHCETPQGLFKKKIEKGLYLEVSNTMITGKGIIYLENSRNEYTGDINYDIKTITKVEQTSYQGLDTFVIYIRTSSLYGVEKVQVRLPGMRDASRATVLLRELMESNKDTVNSVTKSMSIPEPIQKAEFSQLPGMPPTPEPTPAPTLKPYDPTAAAAPKTAPAETPVPTITPTPAATPAPAAPAKETVTPVKSVEEYQKKLAKLETIYQTGIITEKEYKTSKAEYISSLNGLDSFFSKVKVNLQYSEIGFLSDAEFSDFKRSTIEECSDLHGISNDILKQNLKKLQVLNLCEILSDEEYEKICMDITKAVQYVTIDPEEIVIEKIEKWPILKECEIITESQYDQFIKIVADDTKIKMGDSIPMLEHKLLRLTTLSKTFIFTPEEFASKKQEFVADMTALDYTSESKLKGQLERIMTLKRCDWITDSEYQAKKKEILNTIDGNKDIVNKMQLYGLLASISYITDAEYGNFKTKVIDGIFQQYSDISELQKKAQSLMSLKEAGIITEAEFADFKKKLLTL